VRIGGLLEWVSDQGWLGGMVPVWSRAWPGADSSQLRGGLHDGPPVLLDHESMLWPRRHGQAGTVTQLAAASRALDRAWPWRCAIPWALSEPRESLGAQRAARIPGRSASRAIPWALSEPRAAVDTPGWQRWIPPVVFAIPGGVWIGSSQR
jgi:hypothetical protein